MTSELTTVDALHESETIIRQGMNIHGKGLFLAAEGWKRIKDNRQWVHVARSFNDYIKSNYTYKPAWVRDLVRIYETWRPYLIGNAELATTQPTRLRALLPYVTNDNKEELINMACTCSKEGFEDNMRNLKGLVGQDECTHNYERMVICKCNTCGHSYREDGE